MSSLAGLPGAERVERGLRDLNAGHLSIEALLVAAATRRLRELGLDISEDVDLPDEPELALYGSLSEERDPYYRYNALRRELDSFVSNLEARRQRTSDLPALRRGGDGGGLAGDGSTAVDVIS